MTLAIQTEPTPLTMDAHGDLRVGSSRVLLDLVVSAFNNGATPEMIVQMYSTLQLADVYQVTAYYLRHRAEIDDYLRQREQHAAEVRRKIEATQPDLSGIRARLLSRRAQREGNNA
jgi:uncharacterized protein (DUF433 family)